MSALTEAGPDAGAVTFRPYRPSDKETLLAIVGRVWDDRRQRLHEMLWDWQHERDALAHAMALPLAAAGPVLRCACELDAGADTSPAFAMCSRHNRSYSASSSRVKAAASHSGERSSWSRRRARSSRKLSTSRARSTASAT